MVSNPILEQEKIEETIKNIHADSFTVLDFIKTLRRIHPQDWKTLADKFGVFGSKKRCTATTYLSNRLDVYSQKPHSLLIPFTRYKQGKFRDYRRTTKQEREGFGSPWIVVYKKKPPKTEK